MESFFDDENLKQQKLWTKIDENPQIQLIPTLQNKFYKVSIKCPNILKIRYLMLVEDTLYISKFNNFQVYSSLILDCVKFQWLKLESGFYIKDQWEQHEILHGFHISRNQKQATLYTEDQAVYNKWKQTLLPRVFQTCFHLDFVVQKMIGQGSFAKVYLGKKKENNTNYAIKAFSKEFILTQKHGMKALANEIKIMKNLNSQYCLKLFEFHETANSIYFVVEVIEGGQLLNKVRKEGEFTSNELKEILKNMISALSHMHLKHIMHRDLKPENILCRSKDKHYDLVLADFGLATFRDEPNMLFKRCGTPGFVAPEILLYDEDDEMYDRACDIFSAGVIFYLLLTGKQPFPGKTYKEILRANKACEINFDLPQIVNFDEPAGIVLLKQMLSRDPKQRPTALNILKNPFIQKQKNPSIICIKNLHLLQQEFQQGLHIDQYDSKDQIGSLALKSNMFQAMNGQTDTVGHIDDNFDSSRQITVQGQCPLQRQKSKFAQGRQSNQEENTQTPIVRKKNPRQSKKLLKQAITNDFNQNQNQEESGKNNEEYKESNEESDEDTIDEGMVANLNLEKLNTLNSNNSPSQRTKPFDYDEQSPGVRQNKNNLKHE